MVGIKDRMKRTLRFLGLAKIFGLLRILRSLYYAGLDAVGYAVFFLCGLSPRKRDIAKDAISRILVIRVDRIGDLILSTPAIRAVRETFPGAQIHLLVAPYTKDLVVHNPHIDRLLVPGQDTIPKDYDLAIALHPGYRQNALAFKSGARYRAGYTGWGGGFFLTHKIKDDRATRVRHEVDSALEVVGLAGCTTAQKELDVSVTPEGERFAQGFFAAAGLSEQDLVIVVHPGARQEYIRWKKEGFAKAADLLVRELKAKIILSGSAGEKGLIEDVAAKMQARPVLAVGLELTQLVSVIKRSSLYLGNCTGPMHIAVALKVPIVAVFGPVHPLDSHHAWGPRGRNARIVSKDPGCPRCHPSECRHFRCMELIRAEDVLEAAKQLMAALGKIS